MAPSKKIHSFDFFKEGKAYSCRQCNIHIAEEAEKFSTEANVAYNNGHADIFKTVSAVNVIYALPRLRIMDGWEYSGQDVRCAGCSTIIGWKYLMGEDGADQERQGKVQLERNVVKGPDA